VSQHLPHKLGVLHQSLLHGKLPRTLHWADAVELIGHLGEVQPHGEDFAFVVGKHREVFKRPHTAEFGLEEVSRLRRFLKAGGSEGESESASDEPAQPARMVVVIDHHAAHIFHLLGAARPQGEVVIKPYDPYHFHHHLVHRKESHYQGDRVPEETSFYEEVAKALLPAAEIVLIGHGTGKSSAVHVLVEHLKKHHVELSQRVIATETADLSALTEPQAEALARGHLIPVS
jgi:hypothetical protein